MPTCGRPFAVSSILTATTEPFVSLPPVSGSTVGAFGFGFGAAVVFVAGGGVTATVGAAFFL